MPTEPIVETGSEVKSFIKRTLTEVKDGTEDADFEISGTVDFELEITEKKEAGASAGFKSFIRLGGKKEGESIQKVKFSTKKKAELVSPEATE